MTNEDIVAAIIAHEGGLNDGIARIDPGGVTKYGITKPALAKYLGRAVSDDEVRALDVATARAIYFEDYLAKPGFVTLADWRVRYAVADFGVNSGPSLATRYLQEVVGATQDGRLGANTIGRVNTRDGRLVAIGLCSARNLFLARWAAGDVRDVDRDGVPDRLELLPGIVARVGRILMRVAT